MTGGKSKRQIDQAKQLAGSLTGQKSKRQIDQAMSRLILLNFIELN